MRWFLSQLDRRAVYLLVLLLLGLPIALKYTLKPSRMEVGTKLYNLIEKLEGRQDSIAMVALDFGPNTQAENEVQAEVLVEHLMRRRIPIALFSLYPQAVDFLDAIPKRIAEKLSKEKPEERWLYGVDWVNLGYRAGQTVFLQSLPKSSNITEFLGKDEHGTRLIDLPAFKNITDFKQIVLVGEVTGLAGMFDIYVQFFQRADYIPPLVHGCTSITIPEAYNFLDSGQLKGLIEGLAGAAWYSELLHVNNPGRAPDRAAVRNTVTGIGHLIIIALVILGNVVGVVQRLRGGRER